MRIILNRNRINSVSTPILKKFKAHFGTDYAAKYGTPIMSTGDGIVIKAQYNRYNGNYVKIRHNSIYTTQYLHMSRFAKGIKPGVKVKQGQIIGYVGSTGLATGPHVCYRFWKNSKQVNSLKEKFPSSHPVKKGNLSKFTAIKNQFIQEIDNIKFPQVSNNKQLSQSNVSGKNEELGKG